VAIWDIRLDAGASFTLPPAAPGSHRCLYFFRGSALAVAGRSIPPAHRIDLRPDREVALEAGPDGAELLLLQGRPIGEPVAQAGPFVMNAVEDLRASFEEYRRVGFGAWPWNDDAPVLPREEGRFARLVDGRVVRPEDAVGPAAPYPKTQ
jgi:redox-sensitive bicupin YhaK (pirin superfamily)